MDDPWGSPWADEAAFAPPDQKREPVLAEESPRKDPASIWDVDESYGVWDQPDPVEKDEPRSSGHVEPAVHEGSNEVFGWQATTPKASEFQDDLIGSQSGVDESQSFETGFESSLTSQNINTIEVSASIPDTDGAELPKEDDGIASTPTLDQTVTKTDDVFIESTVEPDLAVAETSNREEPSADTPPAQDDKEDAQSPAAIPQETVPNNSSISKRSSTVSSHDEQNDTAASSKTSFELETRSPVETPTEVSDTQTQEASVSELEKPSIDSPTSNDGQLSPTGTILPPKSSDGQSEVDDADFGDFEEEITDEPLDTLDIAESETAITPEADKIPSHRYNASSQEPPIFAIDYASISSLFDDKPITLAEPAKDSALIDDFSTVEQRKTWYRLSRYGSMQKHNMGNDESYTRVKWPSSKTRDKTLKIVARWMNEGRFGGAPALIGSGNARSGTLFGWGESGSTTPVDMASIWASRRSSPQPPTSKSTTPANSKPSTPRIDTFMSPPPAQKIVEVEKARPDKPFSSPRLSQDDSQFAWSTPDIVSPISKSSESKHLPTTAQSPTSPVSEPLKLSQPPSKTKAPSPLIAPRAFHAPKPTSLLQQAASKRISLNLPANSSPILGHRSSSSMVNIPHIVKSDESTDVPPMEASLKSPAKVAGLGLSIGSEELQAPAEKSTEVVQDTSFNTGLQSLHMTADAGKTEVKEEDDDDEWGEMVESAPPTPSDFRFPPSPTFALSEPSTINNPAPSSIPSSHLSQDGLLQPTVKPHKPSIGLSVPFSPPLYTPPSPTLLQPDNSFRGHKPSLSVGSKPSSPEQRISRSPVRSRQVAFATPSYAMPTPDTTQPVNSFTGHRPSMSVGGTSPSRPPRRQSRSPVDLRYGGFSDFTLPSPTALRPGSASKEGHRSTSSMSGIPSAIPNRRPSKSPVDLRYGTLQSEVDAIMDVPSRTNRRTSSTTSNMFDMSLIDIGDDIRPARAPPSQLVATMEARRAQKSASMGGMQANSRPQPPPLATAAKGYKPAASFDEILSPTRDFLAPASKALSPIPSNISEDLFSLSNASASPTAIAPGDFSLLSGLGDLPENIAEHLSPVGEYAPTPWKIKTQAEESQERDNEIVRRIIGGLPNFSYMLR